MNMSNKIRNVEYRNLRLDPGGVCYTFNDIFKGMLKMCHGVDRLSEDIVLKKCVTKIEKVLTVTPLVLYQEIVLSFFREKISKTNGDAYSSKNFDIIVDYFSDESAWNESISILEKKDKYFPDYFHYNYVYVLRKKRLNKPIAKISIICIDCLENNWEMHLLINIEE